MTNPKEALEWYERKRVEARAMVDRDCNNCRYHKPDGCSRWECEYVPRADDIISRADAIEAVATVTMSIHLSNVLCDKLLALPSAGQNCVLCEYYTEIETDDGIKGKCTKRTGSDLISRQDALAEFIDDRDVFDIMESIESLPSVDRQEVESATINNEGITFYYRKTGEWIEEDEYGDLWVCDQCGFASEHRDNFCPNCGAKMRGEEE